MARVYGLTPTGFYAKPLTVIADEVDAGLQGILGQSAGTDSDGKLPTASRAGQLKALIVDGYAAQWDGQEALFASVDPNKNSGASQDVVCSITGTTRNPSRQSLATGTCVGVPLTSLPVGRAATVQGTASRFSTPSGATIATGTAWAASGAYLIGDMRYANSRTYQCIATGIAGASGPTGTSSNFTDNQVHWKYMGDGIGFVHVPFISDSVGAIGVATGSLNTIVTPISGWNAVTNLHPGDVGAAQELDSALRVRRDQELSAPGNTTVDAIRANILKVNEGSSDSTHAPPTACEVFFNDTDFTDVNGLPAHSVEILVQNGTDADIAQAIWDSVGAGTATFGDQESDVVDSEGNPQTVRWTRPTEVPIYVTATGRYDAADWPQNADLLVAQAMLSALLTFTGSFPIKLDVRASPLLAAFLRGPSQLDTNGAAVVPADPDADPVSGLLEVDPLYFGTSASPSTSTQIAITRRQIATFDSSRCVLTASSEDP